MKNMTLTLMSAILLMSQLMTPNESDVKSVSYKKEFPPLKLTMPDIGLSDSEMIKSLDLLQNGDKPLYSTLGNIDDSKAFAKTEVFEDSEKQIEKQNSNKVGTTRMGATPDDTESNLTKQKVKSDQVVESGDDDVLEVATFAGCEPCERWRRLELDKVVMSGVKVMFLDRNNPSDMQHIRSKGITSNLYPLFLYYKNNQRFITHTGYVDADTIIERFGRSVPRSNLMNTTSNTNLNASKKNVMNMPMNYQVFTMVPRTRRMYSMAVNTSNCSCLFCPANMKSRRDLRLSLGVRSRRLLRMTRRQCRLNSSVQNLSYRLASQRGTTVNTGWTQSTRTRIIYR